MKVVLDTNIFVMSLSPRSLYHDIFLKLKDGEYELVVTSEILLEYEEILARKYNHMTVVFFLSLLEELGNVNFIRTHYHWNLIRSDPDDNKFVDAALATGVEFLVSQDKHFNILKDVDFPLINVIGIDDFLEIVNKM